MNKDIIFNGAKLKVYDLFVLLLIPVFAVLVDVLTVIFNMRISGSIAAPIIIGAELAYLFLAVKRNAKKSKKK